MGSTGAIAIIDVTDDTSFGRIPPCADPGFDHRSCDYWEDADRGSKAIRLDWLEPRPAPTDATATTSSAAHGGPAANPFLADRETLAANPFALPGGVSGPVANPFAADDDRLDDNPFAPRRAPRPTVGEAAPPKLRLLGRGLGVAGSYAKVLLVD